VGVTAYAMSKYSVGGWVERSAVLFFNISILFSLFPAWHLHREPVLTLRWITRGNRSPSRHRNYPPGDGNILCHQ
jgi:hypothetical protein